MLLRNQDEVVCLECFFFQGVWTTQDSLDVLHCWLNVLHLLHLLLFKDFTKTVHDLQTLLLVLLLMEKLRRGRLYQDFKAAACEFSLYETF